MGYKEKYEHALEIARELMNDEYDVLLSEIFPELKEIVDKKIGLEIRNFIWGYPEKLPERDKWLAWFEKQKSVDEIVERCKNSWYNEGKIAGMTEGLTDDEKYQQGWHDALEKQGKPNPYSGTSFEYDGHTWGMCARDNGVEILFDGELKAFLSLEKSFIYPIYPQPSLIHKSAQETINGANVEPKFKVGDWIVQENIGVYKVIEICESWYEVVDNKDNHYSIGFDKEYMCHLWTIEDAKDGDVLAEDVIESHPSPFVAIYKKQNGELFETYCFIGHDGKFYKGEIEHACEYVYPATKEQNDLLFTKMKEAWLRMGF